MNRFASALALCLLLASAPAPAAEEPPVVDAADLVDPAWLAGPGWRVESQAPIRGGLARFTLHTDWGTLQADGVEQLAVRVAEVPALARLHEAKASEVVAVAARERAMQPVDAAAAIASDPAQAGLGLPAGVGRFFADRWDRLGSSVRRVADLGNEHWMHSGSPYTNPGGALGAAGDEQPERRRGLWRKLGRETGRLARQELGYSSARRALAQRLGVDPGTRNPLLVPRLDALAWAETSGRYATGYVLALAGGPATAVMSNMVQVDQWVMQARPEQVRRVNAGVLELHCVDALLARNFLRDGAYGALLQSEFVRLLDAIDPDEGCELLLEIAMMAGDEPQARFVVHALRLLDASLSPQQRRGRFVAQGAWMAYLDPGGELWLPLGLDWLGWTEDMARWFDQPLLAQAGTRHLLVAGQVSPRARRELEARGWRIEQPGDYTGRPPYRVLPPGAEEVGSGGAETFGLGEELLD